MVEAVSVAAVGGDHITGFDRYVSRPLLRVIEALAGLLLVADLAVVSASVVCRYVLEAPLVWSDDVARALLLGVSFLGAAAALARGENAGVSFFADRLPPTTRRVVDAIVAVLIIVVTAGFFWNAIV